ncbi:MAG: CapA family protein [Candidatus Nomurabacteria bacterium]|nr:MAG: CapA family protein [Candidatus Nomurabacteria bacterium]
MHRTLLYKLTFVLAVSLMLTAINLYSVISIKSGLDFVLGKIDNITLKKSDSSLETVYCDGDIYFTGDIMLARHVETLSSEHGSDYMFEGLDFLKEADCVVANFEGSIPTEHVQTPDFTFNFSVDNTNISALTNAGFTHLSLANNHSYDFGELGYSNTLSVLKGEGFTSFGHPNTIATSSVTFIDTNNSRVALIAINTIGQTIDHEDTKNTLSWATTQSSKQIVYIHWGNEYKLNQSEQQQDLAKELISDGADLIIGHHPHVTQGIEQIDGVPVIYSLGNLVFDQYFSQDVQQGLIVAIDFQNNLTVNLYPITSMQNISQPHLMSEKQKVTFLEKLTKHSPPNLKDAIISGQITQRSELASSRETVIMTP